MTDHLLLPTGEVVWFDAADAALLKDYCWSRSRGGSRSKTIYAYGRLRGHRGKSVYMHRLLLGNPTGTIDHVDRDGLNNRRANLRVATWTQQRANSCVQKKRGRVQSRYKGVIWYSRNHDGRGVGRPGYGRWRAQLALPDGTAVARYTDTEDDAALWYNALALKHFGEFARLNEVA